MLVIGTWFRKKRLNANHLQTTVTRNTKNDTFYLFCQSAFPNGSTTFVNMPQSVTVFKKAKDKTTRDKTQEE